MFTITEIKEFVITVFCILYFVFLYVTWEFREEFHAPRSIKTPKLQNSKTPKIKSTRIIIFVKIKILRNIMYGKRKAYKKAKSRPVVRRNYARGRKSTVATVNRVVNSVIRKKGLEPEKKRFNVNYNATDYTMGQVAGNVDAFFASDVTPIILQGDGVDNRSGSQVKITSLYMTLQFRQMSAMTQPCKIVCYLIRAKGYNDSTAADLADELFNANNYIGTGTQVIDYLSDMKIDNFGNYQILKKFYVSMPADNISGVQMPVARTLGLKFRNPLNLRYVSNSTPISQGRLFFMAFPSNGNASTTTACTLANVPITAVNTGQFINFNIKYYYTDV